MGKGVILILTNEVVYLLNELKSFGFDVYIVGGAVRNFILNRKINDYDITTNAKPEDIIRIFDKTIPTGRSFGTVTVIINNINFEVTTFRKDGKYINGRKPEEVIFSSNLMDDLRRRDFTINTLCIDVNGNIIDYLDGRKDIENKLIKTVGNPNDRFNEDYLRMLRAVRLMAQISGTIDKETENAILFNYEKLSKISIERVNDEFSKILLCEIPSKGIRKLMDLKLLYSIIPELYECKGFEQKTRYHNKCVLEHILSVLDSIEPTIKLRLSALLHDIGKPLTHTVDEFGKSHFYGHEKISADMSQRILKRLRYPNKIIKYVETLIRYHLLKSVDMKDKAVKRLINNVGKEKLEDLFKLQIADIKGKALSGDFKKVEILREKCYKIINSKEPLNTNDIAINGNDLIEIGFKEGIEIGRILNKITEMVIVDPKLNNKSTLIEIIRNEGRTNETNKQNN